MENYELLGTIGEGTYGVVLKARHKETGQTVAIKKFKESDEAEEVRKTALREVRILKQLRHDNIVGLLEVFRRKRKLYLVFEFVESTLLQELERRPEGLDPLDTKKVMWQLVRGIDYLHQHQVIHRDIKPENLLLSRAGVLKLCDFGFARTLSGPGARYTDYVSTRCVGRRSAGAAARAPRPALRPRPPLFSLCRLTRPLPTPPPPPRLPPLPSPSRRGSWYRCPELLIGDTAYGKAVDMWALGGLMAEVANGLPLFPGESDVDQLMCIMRVLGSLTPRMGEMVKRNPLFAGVKLPEVPEPETLDARLASLDPLALDVIKCCLRYEPLQRITASELLRHPYFAGLEEWYLPQYRAALESDAAGNILGRRLRESEGSGGKRSGAGSSGGGSGGGGGLHGGAAGAGAGAPLPSLSGGSAAFVQGRGAPQHKPGAAAPGAENLGPAHTGSSSEREAARELRGKTSSEPSSENATSSLGGGGSNILPPFTSGGGTTASRENTGASSAISEMLGGMGGGGGGVSGDTVNFGLPLGSSAMNTSSSSSSNSLAAAAAAAGKGSSSSSSSYAAPAAPPSSSLLAPSTLAPSPMRMGGGPGAGAGASPPRARLLQGQPHVCALQRAHLPAVHCQRQRGRPSAVHVAAAVPWRRQQRRRRRRWRGLSERRQQQHARRGAPAL